MIADIRSCAAGSRCSQKNSGTSTTWGTTRWLSVTGGSTNPCDLMSWAWRSTMKFSKFVEFADAAQLPMNDQVSFDADDFFYKLKELTEQFSNDQIAELIPVGLLHEPDVWPREYDNFPNRERSRNKKRKQRCPSRLQC